MNKLIKKMCDFFKYVFLDYVPTVNKLDNNIMKNV